MACAGHKGEECVKCKEGFLVKENACVSQCGPGYWKSASNECAKCPNGCSSCDETRCFQCSEQYDLSSDQISCVQRNPVSELRAK